MFTLLCCLDFDNRKKIRKNYKKMKIKIDDNENFRNTAINICGEYVIHICTSNDAFNLKP